jgi:hypothetical protein
MDVSSSIDAAEKVAWDIGLTFYQGEQDDSLASGRAVASDV